MSHPTTKTNRRRVEDPFRIIKSYKPRSVRGDTTDVEYAPKTRRLNSVPKLYETGSFSLSLSLSLHHEGITHVRQYGYFPTET